MVEPSILRAANAAGSANHDLVTYDSSNRMVIGTEAASGVWLSNSKLGFFTTAPVTKPTVTGAKGGNAALTSLMTALAGLGLVTDSTT